MAKSEPQPACMTKKDCIHHWVIKTANGPTSQGVCATCGSSKEFVNSVGEGAKPINQGKSESDEPSSARTPWMQSWPAANMKDGSKKK